MTEGTGALSTRSCQWCSAPAAPDATSCAACGAALIQHAAIADIGIPGVTHLQATTSDEWETALERLLCDGELRRRMASAGRAHAETHYALAPTADQLAALLHSVASQ